VTAVAVEVMGEAASADSGAAVVAEEPETDVTRVTAPPSAPRDIH